MASTYSDLKIELIGTGEQVGTWGATTNTNLGTAIEEAIVGSADVSFSSADVTLTLTNSNVTQTARHLRLNLTGTSGGARNLILGSGCQIDKPYIINNGLADTVTVKNTTGTGIDVPAGKSIWVYNNGTDVVDAVTHLSSLTLGSALSAASGGTGRTTLTANNVILGNGTSAVGFVAPGSSGNILVSNGTTWASTPNTFGDVVGPSSSTDNAIARFDSTTGKLIQNSSVTIADNGQLLATNGTTALPAISASSDPDTGISFSGSNVIRFSAFGTQCMSISLSGAAVTGSVTASNNLSAGGALILTPDKPFADSFNYLAFGIVVMSPSDTVIDTDIAGILSGLTPFYEPSYTNYVVCRVTGTYDAGDNINYARITKNWQQAIFASGGSSWTIAGASLIGTGYQTDGTNFPVGAVNATRVQLVVSGSSVFLRLTNRSSPAAFSQTTWGYYIHNNVNF
jgi:hypothetical protein